MKYQPYPAYKDSGVEWLGQVPEHWEVLPLKRLITIHNGQDYKKVLNPDGAYPVIGSGGEFARASRPLFDGESVLLGRKGTINRPLYINGPFWTVDTMFYSTIQSHTVGKFVYYAAKGMPFDRYATNTAVPSMTQRDLATHTIAAPPKSEQSIIAAALDSENIRIDALVSKKTRFIELLQEKRQALITRAVTRGLNPDAPMKDSGVEWIGEVPEHWEITPLKRVLLLLSERGGNETQQIALENIESWTGQFIPSKANYSGTGIAFEPGDLLFGKLRPYLAKAFLAQTPGQAIGDFFVMRPTSRVVPHYVQRLLLERSFIEIVDGSTYGTKMPRVSWKFMGNMPLPLPPIDEQQAVASRLEYVAIRLDTLITKTRRSIELLQERRSALITAAVTGQIDLREAA